jgi:putative endonuclease
MNWSVYIILCSDESLYTGITIDIDRRINQHATGLGAKYFRNRSPKELAYLETGHNRSSATKREMAIKKLSKAEKIAIIINYKNTSTS